jgi:hypothetical protein
MGSALKIETVLGSEMATSETNVHKNTNVPVFYTALGPNDFYAGKSITRAIGWGGVGPENLDFFGPKWHSLGPNKKVFIIRAHPLPMVFIMDLPASKSLCPKPYKQQVY